MVSTLPPNRTVDVCGTHRFMFFTRRTVGRSSTIGNSRKLASSRTTGSHPSTIFQTASTQTDMRDSEIQTDPWWHRSEGVPLLCCRGSHRKLERAKWNARAYLGAFDHQQQEEDQDVTHQESLSTLEDGDTSTGTQTLGGTTTQSKQRTVSCGPSYGSRACFPDPLDLWVSTYQKLRIDDEIEEEKISLKKNRLLKRQESRNMKRHKHLTTESSQIFRKPPTDPVFLNRRYNRLVPKVLPSVPKLDNATLEEALDQLCQQIQEQFNLNTIQVK
ncbi:hypothetical protein DAPPUDRAFT_111421 [Daphnia pulex]|uniref:Uncharacterized protein n=1 Tax=Daphnia pulex TaxID=6669 RepID=E9H945_DAPPU|nr:hypothetical protein DAPPUDRAFT_111421 [Daphnia pulex]|eukprot:EFX71759.1 hypothetical protein DAPPUDRAFT_111421 [Daphnia pulex]